MRRWVVKWEIVIRWDDAQHSPWQTTKYHTIVDTPDELRALIQAARADPHSTGYRTRPVPSLVGEEHTECPAGHRYPTMRRADGQQQHAWVPCSCGGHFVMVCDVPGCAWPRVPDPVVAYDCDADQQRLDGQPARR